MTPPDQNPYQSPTARGAMGPSGPPESADLTTADWLLCIFCSGIACIIGIIRLIRGKPSAGKMIGFSLLFGFIWGVVRTLIELALQSQ